MSQSRFSIVLVGVSALLRRPLVSRLRPADGERSSWVVFAARGCRFDSGFRSVSWFFRWAGWPSGSRLPLFGTHRFGVAARRVGLRAHDFRFRHAPLRGCPRRVGLRAHDFRFSARTASGLPLGELVLPPSASEIALGGLILPPSASEIPLGGWPSGSLLPLFGTHRFGVALVGLVFTPSVSELPLGELAFGLTASAFRPAPLRSGCWASSFFRLPLRRFPSAGWPSGSLLPLFGMHRFGVAAGRIGLRASASEWPRRAGSSAGRVGLRAHCFRFSACTASGLPSAG